MKKRATGSLFYFRLHHAQFVRLGAALAVTTDLTSSVPHHYNMGRPRWEIINPAMLSPFLAMAGKVGIRLVFAYATTSYDVT
ncbi:MAG: hypothetical protein ACRC8D_11985 [Aeromonas sp.]